MKVSVQVEVVDDMTRTEFDREYLKEPLPKPNWNWKQKLMKR